MWRTQGTVGPAGYRRHPVAGGNGVSGDEATGGAVGAEDGEFHDRFFLTLDVGAPADHII